jgi:hypothetical protein
MSKTAATSMDRRLRLSGILILIGLSIQLGTLGWNRPLSFLAFLAIGTPFVICGIALYLYSLVTREH